MRWWPKPPRTSAKSGCHDEKYDRDHLNSPSRKLRRLVSSTRIESLAAFLAHRVTVFPSFREGYRRYLPTGLIPATIHSVCSSESSIAGRDTTVPGDTSTVTVGGSVLWGPAADDGVIG